MTQTLRYWYWLLTTFVKKHKLVILPAALIGALFFSQVPRLLAIMPSPKPVERIGRVGNFTLTTLPQDIQQKISRGLTKIDESGRPQPDLASEWQVIDDGRTYIFTLRDDIYWQDGTPVLSSDIDYNINDVTTEILDDKTIVFRLQEAFTPFPTIVSQPIFKRERQNYFQVLNRTQIYGTGDYQLKSVQTEGGSLTEIHLESDKDKIHYYFYNTEQSAILGFKLAEVDVLENMSNIGELADWNTVKIDKIQTFDQYTSILFNVTDPNLADKQIRQALAYMIPKTDDDTRRATSPISAKSWAFNPNVKPYEYSPENARSLLEGMKTDFTLELTTTPSFVHLADEIKKSWSLLGIDVQVKVVNMPNTNDYQALLIGQQIPPDPDQYVYWHSTQDMNITNYESPKVDKLLEDGRKEADDEARKEIYINFQRFIVEDTPAIFLYYLDQYRVERL